MAKTETLHIISHVLVSLVFLNMIVAAVGLYFLANEFGGKNIDILEYIFIDAATIGIALLVLLTLVWSIYFIRSYHKTKVENKYFRTSALIVIFVSIASLFASVLIFMANALAWKITLALVLLFILSFIIFLIGYYKNKIN